MILMKGLIQMIWLDLKIKIGLIKQLLMLVQKCLLMNELI